MYKIWAQDTFTKFAFFVYGKTNFYPCTQFNDFKKLLLFKKVFTIRNIESITWHLRIILTSDTYPARGFFKTNQGVLSICRE